MLSSYCTTFHPNYSGEVDAKHITFQMCDALAVRAMSIHLSTFVNLFFSVHSFKRRDSS